MSNFKCGVSGGFGGHRFETDLVPDTAYVSKIIVRSGEKIDAIGIQHKNYNGGTIIRGGTLFGGSGGNIPVPDFDLAEGEYIVSVEGWYGQFIDSLKITTSSGNERRFGGDGGQARFEYTAPTGCEIVGFWGLCGDLIDAIGVVIRTIPVTWPNPLS